MRAKAVGISTRYGPQTHEVQVNGTISLSLSLRDGHTLSIQLVVENEKTLVEKVNIFASPLKLLPLLSFSE